MSKEQWPVDAGFRLFASNIADAVTWALANRWNVVPAKSRASLNQCCPLGAVIAKRWGVMPEASHWIATNPMPFGNSLMFATGFDSDTADPRCDQYNDDPYFRLGREYRRHALGEVKWGER